MSRFVNLEFGDESEDQSQPKEKALVKDEAYYFSEASAAFESGNFEQALRLFSKVLEFNPQNTVAWTGQVRMLIELGEFREAKLWADKALERFPNEPELLAVRIFRFSQRNRSFDSRRSSWVAAPCAMRLRGAGSSAGSAGNHRGAGAPNSGIGTFRQAPFQNREACIRR